MNTIRNIRTTHRRITPALLLLASGFLAAGASAQSLAFGQSVRLDATNGLDVTMRSLTPDEFSAPETAKTSEALDRAVIENWESELGSDFREQAADLFAPKAGTVGIRRGDLDGHFRGGGLLDGPGLSSVMAWMGGSNLSETEDMRTLGVAVEPRSVSDGAQTRKYGDRVYTLSVSAYPTDANGLHTRLLISRHLPGGKLDPSFGNAGGGSPGFQYLGTWVTWNGEPVKWTPLKALPVFQSAGASRPQYQRFVVLGSMQLSEVTRAYGLLCLRVRPEQDVMEFCPGFGTNGWVSSLWGQDFFQNDTSWTTDLDWVPGDPGQIVVAGQVRNNPANYQDLDFWVAKHSMGTGERMTSFGPGGERVYDIVGNSRDWVHTVKFVGSAILVGGNSYIGGSIQGSVIKVDDYNGTLVTSFCPASASAAECGSTSVRAGKRLFLLESGDSETSVRAIDYRSSRYLFGIRAGMGKLWVRETDGHGKAECAAGGGLPACRKAPVDGHVGLVDGGGGLHVRFDSDAVDLFAYNKAPGNNDSGVLMRHLVTNPFDAAWFRFDEHYSEGAVHVVDFPAFTGTPATKAARVARDSRGRYVIATTARYNENIEFKNRVGIFRTKSDVIYDHSFDW